LQSLGRGIDLGKEIGSWCTPECQRCHLAPIARPGFELLHRAQHFFCTEPKPTFWDSSLPQP
jgi:hypothetical protein